MKLDLQNLQNTFQRRKSWDKRYAISSDLVDTGGSIYLHDLEAKSKQKWTDPNKELDSTDWEYMWIQNGAWVTSEELPSSQYFVTESLRSFRANHILGV